MSERCEYCEERAVANCAGLDIPMLWFCETHAKEHERTCPHIKTGISAMSWPERDTE